MTTNFTLKINQTGILSLPTNNAIQIKGVAGSGKTTIALYRVRNILKPQTLFAQNVKVAIFTFSKTLTNYIKTQIQNFFSITEKGFDGVYNFHKWAYGFICKNAMYLTNPKFVQNGSRLNVIKIGDMKNLINALKNRFAIKKVAQKSVEFFEEEFKWIKGQVLNTKDEYMEKHRVGRGQTDRITKSDKETIWEMFTAYCEQLAKNIQVDYNDFALLCLEIIKNNPNSTPAYTHIVIDEAQDLSKAEITVLYQITNIEKNLTIVADAAQRIYKSAFRWSEIGIKVSGGRTIEFKKNYRNSIYIARAAMSLLDNEIDKSDFTRIETAKKGDQKPQIGLFNSKSAQNEYVFQRILELKDANMLNSCVILYRNAYSKSAIESYLLSKNIKCQDISNGNSDTFENSNVKLCTMSSVKGLEFDNVFVIDLNADIIPAPAGFYDQNDEEHTSTERRLLYTAMTRTKVNLHLLASNVPSQFLSEIYDKWVERVY